MTAFDIALAHLLPLEGGYVNDPDDPGGETNHGISKRAYPDLDIAALTAQGVVRIYRDDYWAPSGCDSLPPALAMMVFDSAVNQGAKTSVKLLQRAVDATDDGALGPKTIERVACRWARDPSSVLWEMSAERQLRYARSPVWWKYKRNWTRRNMRVLAFSVGMLAGPPGNPHSPR